MIRTSHDLCIAYYSRSGHSKRLAAKLADALNAETMEITATAYTGAVWGYIRAGYGSLQQNCVLGPQSFTSLAEFQHVILVGPVWTSYPAVPLRALLRAPDALPQNVSIFLTSGSHSPPQKAFAAGASDLGRPFVATAALSNSAEGTEEEADIVAVFLTALKESATVAAQN